MKRLCMAAVMVVGLVACGGDDDGEPAGAAGQADGATGTNGGDSEGDDSAGDDGPANEVIEPAPPGQATAAVDGREFAFEVPGFGDCTINDETITFSFLIGDNEVSLAGGANRVDGGWAGSIALNVANPEGEPGPISYTPIPGDAGVIDESWFAIDGASMSYTGPMRKRPPNDGSNPPPIEVGAGTISATCG